MLHKETAIRCWIIDSNISHFSDIKFFSSPIIIIYLLTFWENKLYYTTQLITDAMLIYCYYYCYYYYLSYISTCLYSKLIPKKYVEPDEPNQTRTFTALSLRDIFLTLVQAYVHVRVCTGVLMSIQFSGVYFAKSFVFTNIQIFAKPGRKLVHR
jgi:hypothetical protein